MLKKIKLFAAVFALTLIMTFALSACNNPVSTSAPYSDTITAISKVINMVLTDINAENGINLNSNDSVFRAFNTPIRRGTNESMVWYPDIHSLNFIARDSDTQIPYLIQANFNAGIMEPATRNNIFSISNNYENVPKSISFLKISDEILNCISNIDENITNELFKCRDESYSELDLKEGKITFITISETFSESGNTYICFDIYTLITYNTHLESHAPQATSFEKIITVCTILSPRYENDLLLAVKDFFISVQNGDISSYSLSESYSVDQYAGFINGNAIPISYIN